MMWNEDNAAIFNTLDRQRKEAAKVPPAGEKIMRKRRKEEVNGAILKGTLLVI